MASESSSKGKARGRTAKKLSITITGTKKSVDRRTTYSERGSEGTNSTGVKKK